MIWREIAVDGNYIYAQEECNSHYFIITCLIASARNQAYTGGNCVHSWDNVSMSYEKGLWVFFFVQTKAHLVVTWCVYKGKIRGWRAGNSGMRRRERGPLCVRLGPWQMSPFALAHNDFWVYTYTYTVHSFSSRRRGKCAPGTPRNTNQQLAGSSVRLNVFAFRWFLVFVLLRHQDVRSFVRCWRVTLILSSKCLGQFVKRFCSLCGLETVMN